MVTKMSPLNRYFPLVGLETRLSSVFRPYCYVVLLFVFFCFGGGGGGGGGGSGGGGGDGGGGGGGMHV